jgi:CHASE2 domain/CHAT domain
MTSSHLFNLKVQKVEQICLFELTWGQGQRLAAQVNYPVALTQLYKDWKSAYLNFYQSDEMRGRAVDGGVAKITVDWHAELVKAESKLTYEFNSWLRCAELYDIRAKIGEANKTINSPTKPVQVFLTCTPIELDRFPWEAWESEFASAGTIQVIRSPLHIGAQTHSSLHKGRTRILTILGDDTGLDFKQEREALKELSKIADVEFVGWQPNQTAPASQIIEKITDAIADERGWDVLFFAGHSNETELTGGELGIAPGVSISTSEIAAHLSAARERRLKVAIFNSCSGLNIAESLIDLGFSQVMVMREPVHNRVAQEFLVKFLLSLGKHLNVYESMMEARQFLRLEKSHTFPSSYLLPSLFCHPGAELYKIPPSLPWSKRIRQIVLPNSIIEGVALAATVMIGTMIPVQDFLLDGRILSQAVYRKTTNQIPDSEAPPVALIEIDSESITKRKLPDSQILPMNRSYLAQLMERARKLNAPVIGLDFLIDTPQKYPLTADKELGTAVSRAVNENKWVIFGTVLNDNKEASVNDANGINRRNWTLKGYTESFPYYVELPQQDCRDICPISYLMALTQLATQEITDLPKPNASGSTDLRTQLLDTIKQKLPQKGNLTGLKQWRPLFGQQPIIDFSIPPDQVYTKIPAWQLMDNPNANKFPLISKQAVLIATGNDERLGKAQGLPDRMPIPTAMKYWTGQSWMTGGQSLAYSTHHFIRRHLITPIPDIWVIAVAVIVGKLAVYILKSKSPLKPQIRLQILTGALISVVLYGLAALQLYISAALLLPWFLPSSVFLAYIVSATRRQNHA